MKNIADIKQQIIDGTMNESYTNRHISPLFKVSKDARLVIVVAISWV